MVRGAILFCLLLVLCLQSAWAVEADRIIAVVNKEVITKVELYQAMDFELSKKAGGLSDSEKAMILKQNEASFLEEMITTKVQMQEAARLGLDAGEAEVQEAIEGIMRMNKLDEASFEAALQKEGYSIERYKEKLAEDMTLNKIVDREVRSRISASEDEIKRHIADSGKTEGGEAYRLRQIFVKKSADGEAEAMERASAIYEKLKAGEDFASLAAQSSDDPTGRLGGDLGFIKKEHLAPEFKEAISGIKPGGISPPFRTQRGVHIIKLEEFRPGGGYESAKMEILEKKFQQEYSKWVKRLRERSFIEIRL